MRLRFTILYVASTRTHTHTFAAASSKESPLKQGARNRSFIQESSQRPGPSAGGEQARSEHSLSNDGERSALSWSRCRFVLLWILTGEAALTADLLPTFLGLTPIRYSSHTGKLCRSQRVGFKSAFSAGGPRSRPTQRIRGQ